MPRSTPRSMLARRAADMPTAAGRLMGRPSLTAAGAGVPVITGCATTAAASRRFSNLLQAFCCEHVPDVTGQDACAWDGEHVRRIGEGVRSGDITTRAGSGEFHGRIGTRCLLSARRARCSAVTTYAVPCVTGGELKLPGAQVGKERGAGGTLCVSLLQ